MYIAILDTGTEVNHPCEKFCVHVKVVPLSTI